jgi:hypothetical protein
MTMLIKCYDSWADPDTQQAVWLCAEWICALPAHGIRFYIREDRVSLALLADPQLNPRPKLDMIA